MEILVITGFLGAGKTTLVKHLLCSGFDKNLKVAVLVNEVGKIGIDGPEIRKEAGRDIHLLELTNGCICCTIKSSFEAAIKEIHETVAPSYLIVESTGIAQPGDLFEIFHKDSVSEFGRLKNIIAVVDASFFDAREVLGAFYENQIICADFIILNKIDQVDTHELESIKMALSRINPKSPIYPVQHGAIDANMLLGLPDRRKIPGSSNHFLHQFELGGFHSFSFQVPHMMDKQKVDQFLETLPPNVFRCKGWIRFPEGTKHLNFVGGSYTYEISDEEHDTTLVFVGRNFEEELILKTLKMCLA